MKIDQAGMNLIKGFEGLRLNAYRDKAGVWTIGYGSTRYKNGKPIQPGDKLLNVECATDLFEVTLGQYESAVNSYVKVPLTQAQFNSLVSFAYNEGTGALKSSTLLRRLNAKDYTGAADEFLKWTKITDPNTGQKVICDDLVKRRHEERQAFLTA